MWHRNLLPFLCWPELLARSSFNITQPHKFIEFDYDAMGNRVAKHTYASDFGLVKSTYYVLDAQGNTISTYAHTLDQNSVSFNLQEHVLYGSSRLGMKNSNLSMLTPLSVDPSRDSVLVGTKSYELSNHLGNVLTVFRDVLNGDAVSGYSVPVASVADYSPFGVTLDVRTQSAGDYRYGFQGQEKDDEVKGEGNSYDFGARIYDARVGRWLSRDPLEMKYPFINAYNYGLNNPIIFKDIDGRDIIVAFQGGFASSGGSKIKCAEAGTTGHIVKEVLKQSWREGRKDVKSLVFSNSVSVDTDDAFKQFEAIYKKGEKVVIYGYSYGGDAAVEFAEKLNQAGYEVDLLITVDDADGPGKGLTVNRTIPGNVKKNLNFYQRTKSILGSRGDKNDATFKKTVVVNKKITNKNVNHGNIDELTGNRTIWLIEAAFGLKLSSLSNLGGNAESSSGSSAMDSSSGSSSGSISGSSSGSSSGSAVSSIGSSSGGASSAGSSSSTETTSSSQK